MVCRLKEEGSYSHWCEESLSGTTRSSTHPSDSCLYCPRDTRTPRVSLAGHRTAGPQTFCVSLWPTWKSWVVPSQASHYIFLASGLLSTEWAAPVTLVSSLFAKPLALDPCLQLLLLPIMLWSPNCTISSPPLGGWPWRLSHYTWPSCLFTPRDTPSPIPHSILCLFSNIIIV